jgi:hypothetical protein
MSLCVNMCVSLCVYVSSVCQCMCFRVCVCVCVCVCVSVYWFCCLFWILQTFLNTFSTNTSFMEELRTYSDDCVYTHCLDSTLISVLSYLPYLCVPLIYLRVGWKHHHTPPLSILRLPLLLSSKLPIAIASLKRRKDVFNSFIAQAIDHPIIVKMSLFSREGPIKLDSLL